MTEQNERLRVALGDRYTIDRELGAGGMARVFLADDLKHRRKVALKVLRPELAAVLGADRFVQEIETTANLQHPHILPLFDSGEADSFLYYVMPFIDGETLRDKLNRETQLSVDEAVKIATEVADALDYAHRHNVIHRDIKPENVLLHDGRPMVADFGIALAVSAAAGGRMTETGLSLGTPHYMSPEQATAEKDLTNRSDIYSLGSVLYEMLTGDPPHTGSSAQQIIMKIVTVAPRPVTELRKSVPPNVGAAIAKSLEKLPADRFENASAFGAALTDTSFTLPSVGAVTETARGIGWRWNNLATVLSVLAMLFLSLYVWESIRPRSSAPAPQAMHRFVALDLGNRIDGGAALGPDGSIVFLWGEGNRTHLRIRRPGSLEFEVIPGTEGALTATFSPEGDWLAYAVFEGGATRLIKWSLTTEERVELATLDDAFAGINSWGSDGIIYGTIGIPLPFPFAIGEAGGKLDTLMIPLPTGRSAAEPVPIPGTAVLLYSEHTDATTGRLMAYDRDRGDTVEITRGLGPPTWSPTGHVLYASRSAIVAIPFDADRLEVGTPIPVITNVFLEDFAKIALSPTGTLAYVEGPRVVFGGAEYYAELVRPDGTGERLSLRPIQHPDAAISPDGTTMAYTREGRLWLFDLVDDSNRPLADDDFQAEDHDPVWSPDGSRFVFNSNRDGASAIYVQPADGSEPAARLADLSLAVPSSWHEDGTLLLWTVLGGDIYAMRPNDGGSPEPLLAGDSRETDGHLSPDGRWLAYISDESGTSQLWVRSFPDLANRLQVSDGSLGPVLSVGGATWSADGREVIYIQQGTSRSERTRAARLDFGTSVIVESRREVPYVVDGLFQIKDRHPVDGRVLRFRTEDDEADPDAAAPRRLVVVTNWLTELRARTAERN